jgi:hypothetical protein
MYFLIRKDLEKVRVKWVINDTIRVKETIDEKDGRLPLSDMGMPLDLMPQLMMWVS